MMGGQESIEQTLIAPSWCAPSRWGHVFLVLVGTDGYASLRRLSPSIHMEPEWEIAHHQPPSTWSFLHAVNLAVTSRRGFHYIARYSQSNGLRLSRVRHGSLFEEPLPLRVSAVPEGGILVDVAVSHRDAIWLLVARESDGEVEWQVVNISNATSVSLGRSRRQYRATPHLDIHPWEETLLIGIPYGDSEDAIFLVTADGAVTRIASNFTSPAYSPCGRYVAYAAFAGSEGTRQVQSVFVANKDFTRPVQVARVEGVKDIAWTGDGRHLILLDRTSTQLERIQVVDIALGFGARDLFLDPGHGGALLRIDAGALRITSDRGGIGPASNPVPMTSVATIRPDQIIDALSEPLGLEPLLPYLDLIAKVDRDLGFGVREAFLNWLDRKQPLVGTLTSPQYVPAVARLSALAILSGSGSQTTHVQGAVLHLAEKGFELIAWANMVASGQRTHPEDHESAINTARIGAYALLIRAAQIARRAGGGRLARSYEDVAAVLLEGIAKRGVDIHGLSLADVARPLVGETATAQDVFEALSKRQKPLPGSYVAFAQEAPVSEPISPLMPIGAFARLQSPYLLMEELAREPEPQGIAQRWRQAVLIEETLMRATLRRPETVATRRRLLDRVTSSWWELRDVRRLVLTLSRLGHDIGSDTGLSDKLARLLDKVAAYAPSFDIFAIHTIERLPLTDRALFHLFRISWRRLALQEGPISQQAMREAAVVMVSAQRLLAMRGSDPEGIASAVVADLERNDVIHVTTTPYHASGAPDEPAIVNIWKELGLSVDVVVGDVAGFTEGLWGGEEKPSVRHEDKKEEPCIEVSPKTEAETVPEPSETKEVSYVETSPSPDMPETTLVEEEFFKGEQEAAPRKGHLLFKLMILLGAGILLAILLRSPKHSQPAAIEDVSNPVEEVFESFYHEEVRYPNISSTPVRKRPDVVRLHIQEMDEAEEALPEAGVDHLPPPPQPLEEQVIRPRSHREMAILMAAAALKKCREQYNAMLFEDAIISCERALKLNPRLDMARVRLGWAKLELGDLEGAFAAAKDALNGHKRVRGEAIALVAAVLTVRHEESKAIELLVEASEEGLDSEIHERLVYLKEGIVLREFAERIMPHYLCWKKKGDEEAVLFLLRRGITDPRAFDEALKTIPSSTVMRIEETLQCPW